MKAPVRFLRIAAFGALGLRCLAGDADPSYKVVSSTSGSERIQGPRIEFANPVFDFGTLDSGEVVKHAFIFTNTGSATLEITAVKPACGCTTSDTWDRTVEPGKTGKIPIEFNSKGFGGDLKKTVRVSSNDSSQTNVTLQIKGTVWRAFDIVPHFAYFNFLPGAKEKQTRTVRIKSNLEEPIVLSDPAWTNKNFNVVLKTVKEGKEFELTLSADPVQGSGPANTLIELKTSSPKSPVIQVTAAAYAQPLLSIFPTRITLPTSPVQNAVHSTVNIRNNSTNRLELTEATINAEGLEVTLKEVQQGKIFTLAVNVPEGFVLPQDKNIELAVKSNFEDFETIRVPVVQSAVRKTVQPAVRPSPQPSPDRAALMKRMETAVSAK